jgi:hypothetical protein
MFCRVLEEAVRRNSIGDGHVSLAAEHSQLLQVVPMTVIISWLVALSAPRTLNRFLPDGALTNSLAKHHK